MFCGCSSSLNQNKRIYLLYCTKSDNMASAEYDSKVVEDSGGAGAIYGSKTKYIIASAYFDINSAQKVLNGIKNKFSDSGIIELDCSLNKKQQKTIKSVLACKNYYEKLWDFCNQLYNITIAYDKMTIDLSSVYHQIVDYRQQFKVFQDALSSRDEKISAICHTSSMVIIQTIDNFFQSAFISSGINKYLKKLLVLMSIEQFELNNLIQ